MTYAKQAVLADRTDTTSFDYRLNYLEDGVVAGNKTILAKTVSYTLLAGDLLVVFNGTSLTATLPTAVGVTNKIYHIKNVNSTTLAIATTSSQAIDGDTTPAALAQYVSLQVISNGTDWWIIGGSVAPV